MKIENVHIFKNHSEFTFICKSLSVVDKYVREINICKSSGFMHLSSLLLRNTFKVFTGELTHLLINGSMPNHTFRDAWSLGIVTSIPKEGDPLEPGIKLEPMRLLPIPGKLLERALHYKILWHIQMNTNY